MKRFISATAKRPRRAGAIILLVLCLAALTALSGVFRPGPAAGSARFSDAGDGKIIDSQTGLAWASNDYGHDLDWIEADFYCAMLDMRLPTLDELAELYDEAAVNPAAPGEGCAGSYHIDDAFSMTCCCQWAADFTDEDAGYFNFAAGEKKRKRYQIFVKGRVLCVSP